MNDLKQHLRHSFDELKSVVQFRSQSSQLDWLLTDSRLYIPDYFVFNQLGRTKTQQWCNRLSSRYLGMMWHRYVYPKITGPLMTTLTNRFMPLIASQSQLPLSDRFVYDDSFLTVIHDLFLLNRPENPLLTYTDLFWFMTEVLTAYRSLHDVSSDIFLDDKQAQTEFGQAVYNEVRSVVLSHADPYLLALGLATLGNWVDSMEPDVRAIMNRLNDDISNSVDDEIPYTSHSFFDVSSFKQLVSGHPRHILYELDNHGEVWLDLILIELLLTDGHRITLAAKSKPIVNDVTITDLNNLLTASCLSHLSVYLESGQLSVVATGSQMTGQHVFWASAAYKVAYSESDFVILKGQGNFATKPIGTYYQGQFRPYSYRKPMVYMMVVKADLIMMCLSAAFPHHRFGKGDLFLKVC